jgi:hypothetical protein
MAANSPTQADRGFVSEQIVYGVALTYGQAAQITGNSTGVRSNGTFSQVSIRWDQPGETDRKLLSVSAPADKKVHIDVEGFKYSIDTGDGTFRRTPGNDTGVVSELHVKDNMNNDGDKSVIDIFPGGADEDSIFIITFDNPTCRYRFNQATGQWERVCT